MITPSILEKVGNTPLVSLCIDEFANLRLFAKLETYNPTGSVKDRAASYILRKLLERKIIDRRTTIIESTSGNFGVALSAFCKHYGLKFIAVVDSNITAINEMLIVSNGAQLIKVTEPDASGGYLLNRIKKVKELAGSIENVYWVNQYENPLNAKAYYHSLGMELCAEIEEIDYVFLGVSSGGTITGVSQKIKENFRNAQVIAVDVEGSVIFGHPPKRRFIPGIGSSMVPKILQDAHIDDVVMVSELATIDACFELLERYGFFLGGSSGSVFAGIKSYFSTRGLKKITNVACIFPDRGERYCDTLYNKEWCEKVRRLNEEYKLLPAAHGA
jgi:cysteine synthase A